MLGRLSWEGHLEGDQAVSAETNHSLDRALDVEMGAKGCLGMELTEWLVGAGGIQGGPGFWLEALRGWRLCLVKWGQPVEEEVSGRNF